MKTAEEVLAQVTEELTGTSYLSQAILRAMRIYANSKLDEAAKVVMVNVSTSYYTSRSIDRKKFKSHTDSVPGIVKSTWVDTESILNLKDQIS